MLDEDALGLGKGRKREKGSDGQAMKGEKRKWTQIENPINIWKLTQMNKTKPYKFKKGENLKRIGR